MRTLPLLLAALLAAPASAATLRPFTQLDGAVVRLSDLFEGAGNRPLGPGPALGGSITVEAPQLLAIARQFGVDWRPSSSGDRAVLERPGRPLPREEAMAALRMALGPAAADSELEMAAYTAPMIPLSADARPSVSQLSVDPATGRFTALLTIEAGDGPPVQSRLSGRLQEMVELPVPRRRLMPGELITARDLQVVRVRAGGARGDFVRVREQALGQAVRRPVAPSQPIALADLGRPVLVQKGATIRVVLDSPGIALTAQGVATEPGGMGERVRVLNPASKALIEAEVIGLDAVRVLPGAVPVSAPGRPAQVAQR